MSVDLIQWKRNGLCGAASAQMVLHAKSLVGTTQQEQEDLWTSIKDHTTGNSTAAPGSPCSGVVAETFPTMIHEACAGGDVKCWSTHPRALRKTLVASLGTGANVTLSQITGEAKANRVIKKCLKGLGLPIVLINSGTHWVVVDEWDESDPKPVKMLDPALGTPVDHTIREWNNRFMSAVECGAFDHKYVIVQVGP